jgi:glycosyltransferase involved in cell wall biosynthesis
MRVALLSHNARAGDAVGNQVAEKLAFFLDRGAEARVFVESDEALHPAVRSCAATVDPSRAEGDWWRFVSTCDLVMAEYGHSYPLLDLLPMLAGGRPRILLDYHGVTPPELWGPHNREALARGVAQRGLIWCADAVLVHSRYTEQELIRECGYPAERLHRLGFPFDLEFFCPGPTPLRQRLGLAEAHVLLFVGRLAPNKRVPLLVEALGRLRDLTPAVHALVVGDMGDLYQEQARICCERAAVLGVAERLHLLGHLTGTALRDAYRAANVLVVPSLWESFSIPVIEAMACGVPVVASRCTALPDTVADSGLTFTPDDADDLARQVQRILASQLAPASDSLPANLPPRISVVAPRYGPDLVGGAERSLRVIAETLHRAGHPVEVFTTCSRSEDGSSNDLPPGTTTIAGIPIHRFPSGQVDPATRWATGAAIHEGEGKVDTQTEHCFLEQLPTSVALLAALRQRRDQFDAVIAGPYLSGLTVAVAREFADRAVLLPCFHDEPPARLAAWRELYPGAAAILYHSTEEQELAQAELGLNHPAAVVIGTFLDRPTGVSRPSGLDARYLVYCGRYLREKGVDTLLDYARRYEARHPGRFTFVFVGQGDVAIPRERWARDLGVLPEAHKRAVLAGADALVQLSRNESLSLVALEAWAEGTPVLADAGCAVLAGQLRRCGGGRLASDFEDFSRALDDLWDAPERWHALGRQGQEFVAAAYGSRTAFLARLQEALADMGRPLAEQLRRRGLERALLFASTAWRVRFGQVVEQVLDGPPRPHHQLVEVRRRSAVRVVREGTPAVLIAVRVVNWGTHPVTANGPGRMVLRSRVVDASGREVVPAAEDTPLPGLLPPRLTRPAAMLVPVPEAPGTYRVEFWADDRHYRPAEPPFTTSVRLVVTASGPAETSCCGPQLEHIAADLAEASRLQRLPDDYLDVTSGLLASLKRRLKRKLLGNFKLAYVDPLSRQQSAFNRQILAAVQELAECCATLDHALRILQTPQGRRGQARRRAGRRGSRS